MKNKIFGLISIVVGCVLWYCTKQSYWEVGSLTDATAVWWFITAAGGTIISIGLVFYGTNEIF